jgi:hypothetical protein
MTIEAVACTHRGCVDLRDARYLEDEVLHVTAAGRDTGPGWGRLRHHGHVDVITCQASARSSSNVRTAAQSASELQFWLAPPLHVQISSGMGDFAPTGVTWYLGTSRQRLELASG